MFRSRQANVGGRFGPFQVVHVPGLVVQEDADEDDGGAKAGQKGHRVAKYDDGQPDEQDSLGCVGNAAKAPRFQ